MHTFHLDAGKLCDTLIAALRTDILSGALKPGERLPSKRRLAEHHGISVNTVQNAYAQLIAEGYIDQLLLANDLCLKGSLHRYGGVGYDHAFRNFIPMMRLYGISEADIRKIVYENPKRFLFQV